MCLLNKQYSESIVFHEVVRPRLLSLLTYSRSVLALYPKSTSWVQPLEMGVTMALKDRYTQRVLNDILAYPRARCRLS